MTAPDPGGARVVYLSHPSSLEHETGNHPEQPARITAIEAALDERGWSGVQREQAPAVDLAVLERVHPAAHVASIEALSARGGGPIDMDTVTSAGSYEAALHAAGGAARMVDLLLGSGADRPRAAFCGLRPPGHHAEPAQGMGFCLFNNVAVAARHALDSHGAERVLVLDWDVHHGNGTNDIFHSDPAVLFASVHQSPLYPGTGAAGDAGSGDGLGYTVNLPVPAGSGDETFVSLVEHLVVPLAREFAPRLVLVSAGYDAHRDDPLAQCEVTDGGYVAMTAAVRRLGEELAAPVGVVLEGGYDLGALGRSVAATVSELAADEPARGGEVAVSPLAAAAVERAARFWPGLSGAG
jgi:acetoin utilization deacetylase AcuC-like enzyme